MDRRRRVALVLALLALQAALAVSFAANYPSSDREGYHPGVDAVADGAVASGDRVALHVRVTEERPTRVTTALGDELRLVPPPDGLSAGDAVEVVGVYRGDGRVEPTGVTAHRRVGVVFAYLASALAGLLVLVLAAKEWEFDRRRWAFRPAGRGEGGDGS